MQAKNKNIEDLHLEQTLLKNGLEKHHINILRYVGDKKKLFHLSIYGKEELSRRIESIVNKKALVQQYPQLKQKTGDIKVLERLKNG